MCHGNFKCTCIVLYCTTLYCFVLLSHSNSQKILDRFPGPHKAWSPSLPESLDGAVVPPLLQVALLVKLPPLVIKTVSHLVANHHPDATIVEGLGQVLGVEEWLQDARWEHCQAG